MMGRFWIAATLLWATPAWADSTINNLSAGTTITGTERIPMFQTANPAVYTTPSALKTYISTAANIGAACAGSDTQVLFTDSTSCAGNAGMVFAKTTDTLTLGAGAAAPTGVATVIVNGAASGSGGGSLVSFQNGGGGIANLGNHSAAFGGTFSNVFDVSGYYGLGFYTNNTLALTIDTAQSVIIPGHVRVSGTAPALTSCGGGSPTISGDDKAGLVTMGTSATGCIITFNAAYTGAPYCVVSWIATPLASQSYVTSNTAITTTQTSTSGNKLQYVCLAQTGG